MVPTISKGRGYRKRKKKKDAPKRTWYHVLQYYDPTYRDGWGDEEISKDYGIVYKLKKELEAEIPELEFRIIMRSSYATWEEIQDDFFR